MLAPPPAAPLPSAGLPRSLPPGLPPRPPPGVPRPPPSTRDWTHNGFQAQQKQGAKELDSNIGAILQAYTSRQDKAEVKQAVQVGSPPCA